MNRIIKRLIKKNLKYQAHTREELEERDWLERGRDRDPGFDLEEEREYYYYGLLKEYVLPIIATERDNYKNNMPESVSKNAEIMLNFNPIALFSNKPKLDINNPKSCYDYLDWLYNYYKDLSSFGYKAIDLADDLGLDTEKISDEVFSGKYDGDIEENYEP